MKLIKNLAKFISISFFLVFIGIIIVSLTIENNYDNRKICRINSDLNIENYQNISNVKSIKLLDNCDKSVIYFELDESINTDNINGIILQFVNLKIKYNNDAIIELIIKNNNLNYIVIIDEEERIDIDYEN